MERNLLPRFAESLERLGAAGVGRPEFRLGSDGPHTLRFIPFEHVNRNAHLVIVGITPGPNQLDLAYARAQELLRTRAPLETVALEAKKTGAFGGPLRTNLLKLLRHFRLAEWLGIPDEASLWDGDAHLLESTSVVPHAAFRKDKMFSGSFEDVLGSRLLRECFEDCFVASLREIHPAARYIALGPTPEAALDWSVRLGVLAENQILGAFPHPSPSAGSQIRYYLRELSLDDLHPGDPVRRRVPWLDRAYERTRTAMNRLLSASNAALPIPSRDTAPGDTATSGPPSRSTSPAHRAAPKAAKVAAALSEPPSGDGSTAVRLAEELLATRLERTATRPTDKIAGFRTPRGREIAIDRKPQQISLWLEIRPPDELGFAILNPKNPAMPYAAHQPRNWHLEQHAPKLAEGNVAWHVRLDELGALHRLLDWYATA